ncbi:hypothetical protein BD413DRAFT_601850 [Trametes elegans]|nr:hypothetical protein BD413DRAFT_601850 [Trametes elegans]
MHTCGRQVSTTPTPSFICLARGNISAKILDCCAFARAAGYRHLWADTFCIDKTSSAELSEAINSMCQWYSLSHVCNAYLHDVDCSSKWFTRGWTLQELWIVFITGVEKYVLVHLARHVLDSVSVSQRMSWEARRKTTRVEDGAYSLMGIFGVHMSIIYGEGRHASIRLQEQITKRIPDQSLFAWGPCAYLRPGEFS